jgi:DNA-binding winged helix-turn-helix (wHTH) protein
VVLDADGVLHAQERWVAVPPLEARVLATLLEQPGAVCHRPDLTRAVWPEGVPADERALDGVVKRLRRRVVPLGVRIHTIARQGFLLEWTEGDQPEVSS